MTIEIPYAARPSKLHSSAASATAALGLLLSGCGSTHTTRLRLSQMTPREGRAATLAYSQILDAERAAHRSSHPIAAHCTRASATAFRCFVISAPGDFVNLRGPLLRWDAVVMQDPVSGRMSLVRATVEPHSASSRCRPPALQAHTCIEG